MDIKQNLLNVYSKYPLMRVKDYFKLLYQSEFLCGCIANGSTENCYLNLQKEANLCQEFLVDNESPTDDFLGISRVNLRPFLAQNKDLYLLNSLFIASGQHANGTIDGLNQKLEVLLELSGNHKIDLPYFTLKREVAEYRQQNYPIENHSYTYKMNYHPAYRVVKKNYYYLFDVIEKITQLLTIRPSVLVAIDGNSGTGKSTFAESLKEYFDCNLIKADDFFLPFDMRTPQRLQETGGNIHYERLLPLLQQAKKGQSASYYAFDCHTNGTISRQIQPNRLTIVEGCYSLHDTLKDFYDLAVIFKASKPIKQSRIYNRDGEESLKRYLTEWIPMEDIYLSNLNLKDLPTIVVDTTTL